MKTRNIIIYFLSISFVVSFILCSFFYLFTSEKNNTSSKATHTYLSNSAKLIVEKVYEDLLIDNFLEAQRKLNLLKESRIIEDYQINKKGHFTKNELKFCQSIFFDKNLKNTEWGKVCIDFPRSFTENSLVNLNGFLLIFLSLMVFIIFLIIFLFKKITQINNDLYVGIEQVLNSNIPYRLETSFWAPVLSEIEKLATSNKINEKKLFDQKIANEKIEMANQVAHDIRSPLATLENIDINKLPDPMDRKLASNAIIRLKGIAENLLEESRIKGLDQLSEVNIFSVLTNVINSKFVEFKGIKIEKDIIDGQHISNLNAVKFESILSNLINNAYEASRENSSIIINTEIHNQKYIIRISDHGRGIPAEVLLKLGREKVSFNKKDGNGLGVYHAAQTINSWGGSLDIESQLNLGTTIKITLPLITYSNNSLINILIENDELVCLTWEARAKKSGVDLKIFKSSDELFSKKLILPTNSYFYIDSELDNERGEDIAQKLYNLGYSNLIMCSGYSKEKFAHLPFIKEVINKSPPF